MTGERYIKDIIYGANDGIITTFAVVAGVAGADLAPTIVVLLGAANLLADGFSMAASNYLGSKSEHDLVKKEYNDKYGEVTSMPADERREMVSLLRDQGYEARDAEQLSALMFKNKDFFVDLMMHEEMEVSAHSKNHISGAAFATFFSFVIAGLVPILPFLFLQGSENLFEYSIVSTAITLFVVGSLRSRLTKAPWLWSGAEMLGVGGVAAIIAYVVGAFLKSALGAF